MKDPTKQFGLSGRCPPGRRAGLKTSAADAQPSQPMISPEFFPAVWDDGDDDCWVNYNELTTSEPWKS